MSLYSIYLATNLINGKQYVGFDSCWPRRMRKHSRVKDDTAIHKAIQKYGNEAFRWQVLYQSKDREHPLNIMEPYFIKEYGTYGNGYNQTFGGEAPMLGKKHTEESKRSMSFNTSGKKNPMYGKVHSEETRRKIREKRKYQIITKETKSKMRGPRKKYSPRSKACNTQI